MSLTLRDAQHLTWKTYKKLEKMNEDRALQISSPISLARKADEIMKKFGTLQNSRSSENVQAFSNGLSQLLFSMFVLAESGGVSLEDSFLQAVDELILEFVT